MMVLVIAYLVSLKSAFVAGKSENDYRQSEILERFEMLLDRFDGQLKTCRAEDHIVTVRNSRAQLARCEPGQSARPQTTAAVTAGYTYKGTTRLVTQLSLPCEDSAIGGKTEESDNTFSTTGPAAIPHNSDLVCSDSTESRPDSVSEMPQFG
jgi:hypothetical protein